MKKLQDNLFDEDCLDSSLATTPTRKNSVKSQSAGSIKIRFKKNKAQTRDKTISKEISNGICEIKFEKFSNFKG